MNCSFLKGEIHKMLHVLVVDDEANIRKTISYCLAADGHTVIAVSNPTDAIEEAGRRSFAMATKFSWILLTHEHFSKAS
jgi:CheY-like chemotaxis protein